MLCVQGLRKRFGDVQALDDMNLEIHDGEIFGFVGGNGAGKTTTMRIILGVLASDAGTVTWNGQPLGLEERKRIGYMPEERGLYPKMNVGDQLVYLGRLHGLSSAAATKAMEEWTERLGVAERRGDHVQKLSLGNQQRVQLAAALVHSPDLLVLDEPFSGLDPLAVEVMSDVLREYAQRGVPVMFSSHQLDLVQRLCNRVGIVRAGRMAACGSIAELQQTPREIVDVTVTGAAPDWARRINHPQVTVNQYGPTVRFSWPRGDDDARAAVVKAAVAAGNLTQLADYNPPLTELYTHLMVDEEEAA
ncbi:MAG: ATP-binding cassette domain-containing protein [Bowdeniella nasicola]|nr:ATP-binding cassette domain-containing protein [Bowdeniella nasicola]